MPASGKLHPRGTTAREAPARARVARRRTRAIGSHGRGTSILRCRRRDGGRRHVAQGEIGEVFRWGKGQGVQQVQSGGRGSALIALHHCSFGSEGVHALARATARA